jgi:large subunit ribosomal protein L4
MSTLTVYDTKGASVGEIEVADSLLEMKKGGQAVHDVVVAQLAGRRGGTASTLRKGEVAGSNKKPWKQKGTGRARAGYRQSPVWRGGGVAFGPHPRSFAQKVNKKVARLAFKRVFSEKMAAGDVKAMNEVTIPDAKTKSFSLLLKTLGISKPVLFIVDKAEKNVVIASRNIPNVEVAAAKDVNVYQLLRYPAVVITTLAMDQVKIRLAGAGGDAK